MSDNPQQYIAVDQLRIGMFVELGLGWMAHPFPSGNFKIATDRQIDTIRDRHRGRGALPVARPAGRH